MTKAEFAREARSIVIKQEEGEEVRVVPKLFATGSCGWHHTRKDWMVVGGQQFKVQVNVLYTIVGSKEWES